ncbi:Alpha/Beta hydrolase protein [Dichotomopilus funicola]|uniref:Alpha/Beta hydrolase protein n=1 Tax=Dichotomopilus funicola TaxID=1934379 RepID=A0AAN6ZPR0_9PEZI|nr:Alpha/Beta hydrolase protein [Dichotomopilus funicola]
MATIQAARRLSSRAHVLPGQLHITELFFEVPLNHAQPSAGTIRLFGRRVRKHERPIVPLSAADRASKEDKLPYLVYLEGGPGFGNKEPQNHSLTQVALRRGYQVLFLDYRGTGLSTPISADSVLKRGGPQEQAEYLKLFRANSIVRDLEAVRLCLTAEFGEDSETEEEKEAKRAWSLFGQSFGGFVSLTYLSKYPRGVREVFLTGGLAPIRRTAEEVYTATYRKLVERNQAYYKKYPEDAERVRRIAEYVQYPTDLGNSISLPSGGRLTVPLLLSLGIAFGTHGGLDNVHSLVLRLNTDLDLFNYFTRASLAQFESRISFDTNPIYAILHEPIYCTRRSGGPASRWAAHRVGTTDASLRPYFGWLEDPKAFLRSRSTNPAEDPLHFAGEMVFPFHFDGSAGPDLARLRDAANVLAETAEWDEDLYDEAQLARNEVPVYAVSFIDDMFVDFGLARETAGLVRGIKVRETNRLYHDAVRSRSEDVFGMLFAMRDDCVD